MDEEQQNKRKKYERIFLIIIEIIAIFLTFIFIILPFFNY